MASIAWTQPSGGYLANATFPAITLEFAYDGLSRRVQKKTITSGEPTMEGYLYDGWNVLMISNLDPANGAHLARKWSCVWRPDVGSRLYARDSWQAAGGVGGLAWLQTGLAQTAAMYTYQSVSGNAEVHIPMMDHVGNVRHYYQIKATGSAGPSPATVTGQVTANLDYDAFGREVRATGTKTPASGQPPGLAPGDPWVDVLPFHFSTKFTDRESGLNYYGYRFYDPVDGRWLNRDPIGERGGINLYGMVRNNPINRIDRLGLETVARPVEIMDNGKARDQSGATCCPNETVKVTVWQIKPLTKGHSVGHAFIETPNGAAGQYPTAENEPGADTARGPGEIRDDSEQVDFCKRRPDRCNSRIIEMCPQSAKKLEEDIDKDRKNPPKYGLGPGSCPNCKEWADDKIDGAGFPSPETDGWVPGL